MRLCVEGLSAGYGPKKVLKELSFELGTHELVGILGANGCGKTTLIKALGGILPYRGHAVLDGRELGECAPREAALLCGYLPQRSGLSLPLSLTETVMMGFNARLRLLETPDRSMRREAEEALDRAGLRERAEENFLTLSEGQKQAVLLARATVCDHRLLLADEPEAALDFSERHRMMRFLKAWASEGDRAVLAVLHDPQLALRFCDRLLLVGEGGLLAELCPGRETAEESSRKLSLIYGPVRLIEAEDRLFLVKEKDE